MSDELHNIRYDYHKGTLGDTAAGEDPLMFFRDWFAEAEQEVGALVNAMTLATADAEGRPSARIVLLKGLDDHGFSFFGGTTGRKGSDLAQNPQAALCFFWHALERQVRIEGTVIEMSAAESEAYFRTRPLESRVSAWAHPQGTEVDSRDAMVAQARQTSDQAEEELQRVPPWWRGWRLLPKRMEFWQGGPGRLHDRLVYTRDGGPEHPWVRHRLSP